MRLQLSNRDGVNYVTRLGLTGCRIPDRTRGMNTAHIADATLAAFTLNIGDGRVRTITVEATHPGSLHPFAVLCDGEPIPVNATDDALFMMAGQAMQFALAYTGWDNI